VLVGAVIVSTPQDLALRDAARGIDLFKKVGVPLLGMVQNMSTFVCSNCGHDHDIFGMDGAKAMSEARDLPLLGDIPLHASICRDSDAGRPTCVADPDGPQALKFRAVAAKVAERLGL